MKKLGKKQMGGSTKTKSPSVDRSLASKIKTESSSLAKKEAPEYKKTSVKTVSRDSVKSPIRYKTGGMVNPNASVQASKVAKGRPAKSAEPKSAEKRATGKVGGISKAPKTAVPKAKYGMVMRKK